MIESIHYQNFQCHQDRLIELEEGVNCLIGATDQGKSSALRGLIWVLLNQPRGNSFITHGQDFAVTTLKVDGHEICRGRRKNYNYYTLDQATPYEAFGVGVPDAISKILQVDPISIQRQLDPPFWFLLTPEKLSKELNAVVNLELIDEVLDFFSMRQKRSKLAVSLSESKLKKTQDRKKELEWVPELELRLEDLEEKEKELEVLGARVVDLISIVDYLDHLDENVTRNQSLLYQAEELVQLGEAYQEQKKVCTLLTNLLTDIAYNKEQLTKVEQGITELEGKLLKENNCPLCGSELKDGIQTFT